MIGICIGIGIIIGIGTGICIGIGGGAHWADQEQVVGEEGVQVLPA